MWGLTNVYIWYEQTGCVRDSDDVNKLGSNNNHTASFEHFCERVGVFAFIFYYFYYLIVMLVLFSYFLLIIILLLFIHSSFIYLCIYLSPRFIHIITLHHLYHFVCVFTFCFSLAREKNGTS